MCVRLVKVITCFSRICGSNHWQFLSSCINYLIDPPPTHLTHYGNCHVFQHSFWKGTSNPGVQTTWANSLWVWGSPLSSGSLREQTPVFRFSSKPSWEKHADFYIFKIRHHWLQHVLLGLTLSTEMSFPTTPVHAYDSPCRGLRSAHILDNWLSHINLDTGTGTLPCPV